MIEIPENAKFCLNDGIGFTALVQHIGDDCGIVNSARVSFGKQIDKIEDKDRNLIKFLLAHQHGTPMEHNSLTFLIKCPLFVARQWMRHRISSFNEISFRYVEAIDEFYTPLKFRKQSENNRQASVEGNFSPEEQSQISDIFNSAIQSSYTSYKKLLNAGVAREQARGVLPLTTYTQYYWTCNLRSFLHFVKLRDHSSAQWEIQQYAKAMLEQIESIFPETIKIWEELGKP